MDRPPLVVPFTKMDGAGNDFIVLDNRFLHFTEEELESLAARFCPRRTGIGADGLLALEDDDAADFRMRYRNADGSLGTMCGNGARCLARFAAEAGLGTRRGDGVALAFETDGGRYRATVPDAGDVRLDVPDARGFGPAETEGDETVHQIWTGTEHAVLFVDDVEAVDRAVLQRLRHDPAFRPTGANVNAVQVVAPDRIRVRTFEKGVEAETLACGTGAIATALVSQLTQRAGGDGRQRVAVEMPGGTLTVGFRAEGGRLAEITLGGPARTVYAGTLEWTGP